MSEHVHRNDEKTSGEPEQTGEHPAPPEPARSVRDASDAAPDAAPEGTAPAPGDQGPAAPSPRPRPRTVLAYALPLLVLLGSGIGSVAYAKASSDGADRTVATEQWDRDTMAPPAKSDFGRGSTRGTLQRQLLPVPEGYRLGPYMSKDSNDFQLSSQEITDLYSASGTARGADAEDMEKMLRTSAPRALAMRSYVTPEREAVYYVVLSQAKEAKTNSAGFKAVKAVVQKAFGGGYKVPGHGKDAFCVSGGPLELWDGSDSDLEGYTCVGVHGDLAVSLDVTGTTLDPDAAVDFFARQLDRLKSTGTAV
ncbi:hypothetical protein [Streptomyces sp. NPDC047046]|uniref:hypothetical protein n=1 Tax=Streptomyces sp. NPDC047046 TaxID=3155378 RepID=UPI0033F207EF